MQISHFEYGNLLTVSQKEKESSNQKYDANIKVWRLAVSENCRSLALKDAQARVLYSLLLEVQDLSVRDVVENKRKGYIVLSPSILMLSLKLNDG